MIKKLTKQITAWSYSRLRTYKQCPQLAKFKFIDKLPEPSSVALDRGNEVHKLLEQFVKGEIKTLPKDLKRNRAAMMDYRKRYPKGKIHCEEEWCFNAKWESTGWFDADAWCRVKMDLCEDTGRVVVGVDYKTGKYRPGEYNGQLLQYCASMLLKFPDAEEARAELMFFDVDAPPVQLRLKRQFLQQTLDKLNAEVEPMLNDTRFAPMPGPLCKWCNFSKEKGGPCKVA